MIFCMDPEENTRRRRDILGRALAGETYRTIAQTYEVGPERIGQVVREMIRELSPILARRSVTVWRQQGPALLDAYDRRAR